MTPALWVVVEFMSAAGVLLGGLGVLLAALALPALLGRRP